MMDCLVKVFVLILSVMAVYFPMLTKARLIDNGPIRERAEGIRHMRLLDILYDFDTGETRVKRQWSAAGRVVGDHGGPYQQDDAASNTFTTLKEQIIDQIRKGHLMLHINHWQAELTKDVQRGLLTSEEAVQLLKIIQASLVGNNDPRPTETCCPLLG